MMNSDSEPELEDDEFESNSASVKTGWLSKQGGTHKNVKKRWFVLTKAALRYYKSEKMGKALGVIFLRRSEGARVVEDPKGGFTFEVITPERVYLFYASSADEMNQWVEAIQALITDRPASERNSQVVKAGYLTKQGGGFKSWKKRFFVLRKDNLLSYYTEEGDVVPLGTIDLEKCSDVRMLTDKSKGFGFELVTPERNYLITANSKEDMEGWMHVLLEIVGNVVDDSGNTQLRSYNNEDDDEVAVSPDEISNFIRMDTKITKEGYLIKQGGKIKTWKRRWFVLRESTLAYYKDEKDDKPVGLISLKECKSFELAAQKVHKPYAFEIATPDRVYVCCAKDEDEMWEWINVLSTAVTTARGKETYEFIALKKASELAAKKKALQIKILRKAAVKNVKKKIARYRNHNHKRPIDSKKEESSWIKQFSHRSSHENLEHNDLEAEEQKMLDDLEKMAHEKGGKTSDLTASILMMENDIAQLSNQIRKKSFTSKTDEAPLDGLDESNAGKKNEDLDDLDKEILRQARAGERASNFACYARAIMDFNPNAYDEEALGFKKGDILIVEQKDSSGNWRGRLAIKSVSVNNGHAVEYSKSGTFPYRYVEEIERPLELDEIAEPQSTEKKNSDWNDQLQNAVGTLFEMYDSDGDGYMTKLDFFEFLYEFGKTYLTDKQVDRCWETLDSKKSGKVDAQSFRNGLKVLDSVDFYSDWNG